MAVLCAVRDFDARIECAVFLQYGANRRLRRRVVGDTQLPGWIQLAADRIEATPQPALSRVVRGQKNRKQRPPREACDVATKFFPPVVPERAVQRDPLGIVAVPPRALHRKVPAAALLMSEAKKALAFSLIHEQRMPRNVGEE